jgi:hypothetical protein
MIDQSTLRKSQKTRSIAGAQSCTMRISMAEEGLRRLVAGNKCESMGCYETASWLIISGNEAQHLCPKHTRLEMRDSSKWGKNVQALT